MAAGEIRSAAIPTATGFPCAAELSSPSNISVAGAALHRHPGRAPKDELRRAPSLARQNGYAALTSSPQPTGGIRWRK